MSCNVIWQCFCTCLLLFRCVLFGLSLILLCSVVSHFPPSPHVFRNHISILPTFVCSCTWSFWLVSLFLVTNRLIINWKSGHTWIWFIPFLFPLPQYCHHSCSHHCNPFETLWIFLIHNSVFLTWPNFGCEMLKVV